MDIHSLIASLELQIENPSLGLPEELFLLVSKLTPLVNVDLLVKNIQKGTLLTWREDAFYGPGWHVPGGIVRFKESMATRVHAVAKNELGATIEFSKDPLAVNEIMSTSRDVRGHFISLLYECKLTSPLDPDHEYKSGVVRNGEWAWHATCPDNLIPAHKVYKRYIGQAD